MNLYIKYPPKRVTYRITARARNGVERSVHFAPDTMEACAGAIAALSCGNRRDARHSLCTLSSYTASNSAGDMLRAEWVSA